MSALPPAGEMTPSCPAAGVAGPVVVAGEANSASSKAIWRPSGDQARSSTPLPVPIGSGTGLEPGRSR